MRLPAHMHKLEVAVFLGEVACAPPESASRGAEDPSGPKAAKSDVATAPMALPPAASGGALITWELKVEYPDKEEKTFAVDGPRTPIPLRSSTWACSRSETVKSTLGSGTPTAAVTITCQAGASAAVVTSALCDKGQFMNRDRA